MIDDNSFKNISLDFGVFKISFISLIPKFSQISFWYVLFSIYAYVAELGLY